MRAFASVLGLLILISAGAATAQTSDVGNTRSAEIAALQQRLTDGGCYRGAINGQASPALEEAIKSCPSQAPVLRIETGMHVAQISRIGVDQACRIAATASDDKTVRVWSLPDGRLLRTLRVPIAPGDAGKVYATAVSPDGLWIAAGGWDAQPRSDGNSQGYVYVFDSSTGALANRVGPFEDVITTLAFSSDGRWLAGTSFSGVGMKVIDTQTWKIVAEDKAYAAESNGVAFAPDGRLYTASSDGKVRQYSPGPGFVKEREVATKGGHDAFSVAVDPQGQLVAIGFADATQVEIYDAATLRYRYAADTKAANNTKAANDSSLPAVGWSSDGARLFAGGGYQIQVHDVWKYALLTFGRDGHRIGGPLLISDDSIEDIKACAGITAIATSDPAFGLVEGNGQIGLWKTSAAPDMRGKLGDAFTIAADAKRVRFGLGEGSDSPVLFDVFQATVTSAPNPPPNFIAPSTKSLPVRNWEDNNAPTFAGKPITLEQYETSQSLAIRPDRTGFILGTEFTLRAFDARGRQIWLQPGPSGAWGVNLSSDGRVVVVAYTDGTIRWLRWSDGQELLALFVNRETKAWVSWTPSGYYMASPGGEDLIGWHLNRGWNKAADFFPASRFRDRFNRPDIVRLVLDTLDENAAIKRADETANRKEDVRPLIQHLPPVIRIANPGDGTHVSTNTLKLDYAVRSPSGQPVERIDILINGRRASSVGLPIHPVAADSENTGSITVKLTQHVTEVGLSAWGDGLTSEAAHIKVTWDGAPEATRKLYAFVVGVSKYAASDLTLTYAAKDARDFAQALQDQKGAYYVDVQTKVLTDHDVTRANIVAGLAWLKEQATNPNDVSVLYLAGHGLTDDKQTYWFFPFDANADNLVSKGVSQDEMRNSLQNLSGKVLWFLDTCHAGSAGKRPPPDVNKLLNDASQAENGGIVVFASSTGKQTSVERDDLGNGIYTKALIEGIELGKAEGFQKGFVTTSSLDSFVKYQVGQLTGDTQSPVMVRPPTMPDFNIAEVRKH